VVGGHRRGVAGPPGIGAALAAPGPVSAGWRAIAPAGTSMKPGQMLGVRRVITVART